MIQIQTEKLIFTEYLKQLPPPWVIEHFLEEDTATRKILSSAVIEESATEFLSSGKCADRFKGLNDEDRSRCLQLYLMGQLGISSDAESGLHDPVVAAFLGYATRDQKGILRLFGFELFIEALQAAMGEALTTDMQTELTTQPHSMPMRSLNDITIVVALASQHQLIKKKNGRLCVSALQAIRKLTHTADIARADDTESLATTITGYCTERKLLIETTQKFLLNPEGLNHWLIIPAKERLADLQSYVLKERCGWNIGLLRSLSEKIDPKWLVLSLFNKNDQPHARKALLQLYFAELVFLQKSGTQIVFKYHDSARVIPPSTQEHSPVIMPDFSVIIPQECPPELLFTFARFCNMQSLDKVYHALVEKALLTEALSNGLEGLQILTVLEQWNAPTNVLETVREWIREFQRLSLTSESVLITSEERVTEQVTSCEQLEPCLERIHVHSLFRIKPGCERTVRDIVKKLGFDDRMPQPPLMFSEEEDKEPLSLSTPEPLYTLVTEDSPETNKPTATIRGTKYGAELKSLDLSEMVQVIDYAILTGQRIVISYEGSPYVRKGIYTLTPTLCSKGVEPLLDGALQQGGTRKQFYVKKIASIGVVPQ